LGLLLVLLVLLVLLMLLRGGVLGGIEACKNG
jgi:hypothetical protein